MRSYPEALDAGSETVGIGIRYHDRSKIQVKNSNLSEKSRFVEEFQLPITQLLDDFRRAT